MRVPNRLLGIVLASCSADDSEAPASGDSAAGSGYPFLGLTPEAIDFGLVDVGSSKDAVVAIANVGLGDLELQDVRPAPADASVTLDWKGPVTIPSGEFIEMPVRWAPTTFEDLHGSLEVSSNDLVRPLTEVGLAGTTPHGDIEVTPLEWDFAEVTRNSTHVMGVSVANVGGADLMVTALDYVANDDDLSFDAAVTPFVIAPGESVDMRVTYSPSNDGVDEAELTVVSDDPDEPTIVAKQTGSVPLLPSCIVGEWLFAGDAKDTSGNGNDGTPFGVTLAQDRNGTADAAYAFDGSGTYIDVPGSESLDAIEEGGDVTIAAWVRMHAWSNNTGFAVLEKYRAGNDDGWELFVQPDRIALYAEEGYAWTSISPSFEEWYFFAVSFDGAADEARFFVDGDLVDTVSASFELGPTEGGDVHIGMSLNGGDEYAIGRIDDLYVFGCPLSDGEIADLYAR
jgi:hypothetical protein